MNKLTFEDLGFGIHTVSFDDGKRVNYMTVPTTTICGTPITYIITEKRSEIEISDGGSIFSELMGMGIASDSEEFKILQEAANEYGCEFLERTGGYVLTLNTTRKNLSKGFSAFTEAIADCFDFLNEFDEFEEYMEELFDRLQGKGKAFDLTDPPEQTGNA